MSQVITKKILPEYFDKILKGEKTYELRLADWDCQPGDTLVLNEIDTKTKKPTGRSIKRKVGYVGKTKDLDFWSKEEIDKYGYQIISLLSEKLPQLEYERTSIQLFAHLNNIKQRLLDDVKPYIEIVQKEAKDNHRAVGSFSLPRMLMPVVETTARAMEIKPQELLNQMSIPNPYLSWSIFRDVFMHNDDYEQAVVEVDGERLTVDAAISISFPGTPAVHTTTYSYQSMNVVGLYEALVSYIDRILADKSNDKKIEILVGIKYLNHDNEEVKKIIQEIKAIKNKY